MIFSSTFFLCVFLPITLILYYVVPWKFKNAWLLLASLFFYAWGEPIYVFLMIFSIAFNFVSGLQMGNFGSSPRLRRKKKTVFISTVVVNIAVLCFFKYYGFFLSNLNTIFGWSIPIKNLPLPIGISFYTFQALSYIIDVYWGKVEVQKNPIDFGAYIAMFPQLIAGPIVRYEDIQRQLKKRTITLDLVADGAAWFIRGLSKKVLLANNMGLVFDAIYALPAASRPALTSWIGIIAYTFQIYFDFSGYSDMAIGLGKMMGFRFAQNFNYPYVSASTTEFWRRWHISLGTWFREYVYIPLGGNRVETWKHIRNILIVWLLTGLWHGADWCFIIWGLYYGIFLIIEKYALLDLLKKLPSAVSHIYTIFVFIIGWLIFTAPSFSGLWDNFRSLFGGLGNGFANAETGYFLRTNLILLIVCGLCATPLVWKLFCRVAYKKGGKGWIGQAAAILIYVLLLTASVAYLINSTYNPFLYFKF